MNNEKQVIDESESPRLDSPVDTDLYSLEDVSYSWIDPLPLPKRFNWMGNLPDSPESFRMMMWGPPGSGKSTLALDFASELTYVLDARGLYVAAEERPTAGGFANRSNLMKASSSMLTILDSDVPARIIREIETGKYKFVILDSVNVVDPDVEFKLSRGWGTHHRNISFIYVTQALKGGKDYLGGNKLFHFVDVAIEVQKFNATTVKNRWGGSMGSYKIL